MNEETRKEYITRYMKSMCSFLDGQGIIITDWELIEEALKECGEFETLIENIKKFDTESK